MFKLQKTTQMPFFCHLGTEVGTEVICERQKTYLNIIDELTMLSRN